MPESYGFTPVFGKKSGGVIFRNPGTHKVQRPNREVTGPGSLWDGYEYYFEELSTVPLVTPQEVVDAVYSRWLLVAQAIPSHPFHSSILFSGSQTIKAYGIPCAFTERPYARDKHTAMALHCMTLIPPPNRLRS